MTEDTVSLDREMKTMRILCASMQRESASVSVRIEEAEERIRNLEQRMLNMAQVAELQAMATQALKNRMDK